jgi:hypothetical protein
MIIARKPVVIVAVLAIAFVALVNGVASAQTKRIHGLHQFESPTRNIACEIMNNYARCDIHSHSWKPPARPATCHLAYGDSLEVGSRGQANFTCHGDTTFDSKAKTLHYGHALRDGRMRCVSKTTGMTCKNRKTGHGFSISKESYRLF